ncbi:flagellar hook-associated protein FlgK [Methylobacterium sp. Leaf112]|uniref:flagellar hook-associated protein FlgK n=1 Tax=Methylobacterium sp. Leaf112 TaxID=1736258 RepID=UPI0006F5442B|nr:flagellar hook-associated protein FlgK [Methylobacterium sp. Leaf112]KQP72214.1 hypothetical protein ASF52_01380 [Methylobacterium sp. Leaf112]
MGLSLALNSARTSLAASAAQIAVTARNTAGANDPYYARRIATVVTAGGGSAVNVLRAADAALFGRKMLATSEAAGSQAVLDGLQTLSQTIGDTDSTTSPAARLGALNAALQVAANKPDSVELARNAVEAARDLAGSLNTAAAAVQTVRQQADTAMATSVVRINDLLVSYEAANQTVTRGTAIGADVTDALDDRDRILTQLSEEIGITTAVRAGNDVAIYTDSGVPLFERGARKVTFEPTAAFSAGSTGNAVMIDGVPVTGAASPMPARSGRIVGLATLRDDVAVRYETQLDALAGGLVTAFAEPRTNGTGPAALMGLFTDGSAGVPARLPVAETGLAAKIRINAAVDPRMAGSALDTLRDGGMNGADYRSNTGAAAYADRLRGLVSALGADRTFDAATGLRTSDSLLSFATGSAGWLEGQRKSAASLADYELTLLARTSDALSNAVGVNTDDETARALELERSYTASAKLLTLVNDLLKTLMDAVR